MSLNTDATLPVSTSIKDSDLIVEGLPQVSFTISMQNIYRLLYTMSLASYLYNFLIVYGLFQLSLQICTHKILMFMYTVSLSSYFHASLIGLPTRLIYDLCSYIRPSYVFHALLLRLATSTC